MTTNATFINYSYQEQQQEEEHYAHYDSEVANAIAEADYQDYYCQDESMESYDCENDSLLSLVLGVQNYLTEQAANPSKCDSALYNLQYKMHTYMRQKANELGAEM